MCALRPSSSVPPNARGGAGRGAGHAARAPALGRGRRGRDLLHLRLVLAPAAVVADLPAGGPAARRAHLDGGQRGAALLRADGAARAAAAPRRVPALPPARAHLLPGRRRAGARLGAVDALLRLHLHRHLPRLHRGLAHVLRDGALAPLGRLQAAARLEPLRRRLRRLAARLHPRDDPEPGRRAALLATGLLPRGDAAGGLH